MRLGQTSVSCRVLSQFHQTEIIVAGQDQPAGQTRFQMNSRCVQIEIRGKLTETRRFPAECTRKTHGDRLDTDELFQIPRFDHLETFPLSLGRVRSAVTHRVFAERVTQGETFVNLHVDHCRVMSFENGRVLLRDVRIPDPSEIIRAARDENVQLATEVETFAALKDTTTIGVTEKGISLCLLCTNERRRAFSVYSHW
jgi:hypothetical protein